MTARYDPGTEEGRQQLRQLSQEGLAELRQKAALSLGETAVLLASILAPWAVFWVAVLRVQDPTLLTLWAGGACAFWLFGWIPGLLRVTPLGARFRLGLRLTPICTNPLYCKKLLNTMASPAAKAYRDEVISRRELISADGDALEALFFESRWAAQADKRSAPYRELSGRGDTKAEA